MKKIVITLFLIFATSFTPIAAKIVVEQISPISLAFFRFGIALFLLFIVFKYKQHNFRIDKNDKLRFLMLGLLVIPINQLCFLNGINLSSASHSGIIYSITPLASFLISVKIKQENYSFKKLFIILLTIIGILIIFYENLLKVKFTKSTFLYGDILLVFAVLSWAAYLTLSKDMVEKYGAVKTSTISFLIGILFFIPFFILDFKNIKPSNITLWGIIAFIHLSLLVSFGSYFLFTYSSKFISVSTLTTSLNSTPIFTIIFSYIFLNEKLSYYFLFGSIITLTGVFLSQIYQNKTSNFKRMMIEIRN